MTRRAVPGFTCSKGHRMTEANTIVEHRPNGATKRKCRTCRQAYERARYAAGVRKTRGVATRTLAPDDPRHGTVNGYNYWRCTCAPCRAAILASQKRRKAELARRAEVAALQDRATRSVAAYSLDEKAERRWGMDRVMVGTVWDDPTAELALEDVG